MVRAPAVHWVRAKVRSARPTVNETKVFQVFLPSERDNIARVATLSRPLEYCAFPT